MTEMPQVVEEEAVEPQKRKRRIPWKLTSYVIVLFLFVLCTAMPNVLAPFNPDTGNLLLRLQPPGSHLLGHTYLLGTDDLGRDTLSRLIYGARISFVVAMAAVGISGFIGTVFGVLAGYLGGVVAIVLMRLADIILSIPFLLLAILVITVVGPGLISTVLVLGAVRWPIYTRVAYGATLQVREGEFISAARSLGASNIHIMVRHIVPNILSPVVVMATLEVGTMIMYEAALSFLGLGIQLPTPSWGNMLSEAQNYITQAWWMMLFPGLAVFLVVLSFNRVGDWVQERLDPRLSVRRMN